MKLIFLLLIPALSYGQCTDSLINELNEPTFMQYGDNNYLWYSCGSDTITMNISQRFIDKFGLKTEKSKELFVNSLSEQYNYLFLQKGFSVLIIDVAGRKTFKELKLAR